MTQWNRAPAVAGAFYPEAEKELRECLASLCPPAAERKARGILVPHAGYQYSGKTAGLLYSQIYIPKTVVLVGPNHTGHGRRISVWNRGVWETPLGPVPIDEARADAVLSALGERPDTEAHRYEHALEVQLPFLKWKNPEVTIVPITLGPLRAEMCEQVGRALHALLTDTAQGEAPLLVISSDMSHFLSAAETARKDRLALERLEAVDALGLYRTVTDADISMCGFIPATAGLYALKSQAGTRGTLIDYSHSGEVSGDLDRVVGYAAVVFNGVETA